MKDYIDKSDAYTDAIRDKLFSNLATAGKTYKELLQIVLDVPPSRTGKIYKNIDKKDLHQAAADQEPPAPLTRELINSIKFEQGPQTDTKSEVYIKSDKEYVLALEFGNASNNLAPKPAWNPTLVTFKDELGDIALEGFYRR